MNEESNTQFSTDEEIEYVEDELGIKLPNEYKMFLKLGGLTDPAINLQMATPSELLASRDYVREKKCLPFASNTFGDLYCLQMKNSAECPVIVWQRESNSFRRECSSFTIWLSNYMR